MNDSHNTSPLSGQQMPTRPARTSAVPQNAGALLDETLAEGCVVLVPKRSITLANTPRLAWWQVDPRSGETIAVTDDALHQTAIEYKVIINKNAGNGILWWEGNGQVLGHVVGSHAEIYQLVDAIIRGGVFRSLMVSWML
ncbi:MAG: hypothetical protein ABR920_05900 [Terriglobales bacterium]